VNPAFKNQNSIPDHPLHQICTIFSDLKSVQQKNIIAKEWGEKTPSG